MKHSISILLALVVWACMSSAQAAKVATASSALGQAETQAIVHAMKRQFDQPKSPLKVAPVVVAGDWALASWLQGTRGGRALLQKRHSHWVIVVCGGEGLLLSSTLVQTGMAADVAAALAKNLQVAEAQLPAATRQKFASFAGMLRVDGDASHGTAHGMQGAHQKH